MTSKFIFILLLSVLPMFAGAAIHVGPNLKQKSIHKAIEEAKSGDTILVWPGTYREGNFVIKKSVVLIGKNYPVLDGQFKDELFTVATSHVTIEGFRIIRSGRSSMEDKAGVKGLDAHYVRIINNIFEETFFGVHLSNTDHAIISGNKLKADAEFEYQSGNGIHLWKCNHATIKGNQVEGHRDGIYFEFVTHTSISGNIAKGNLRYGLHFMFSHDNIYEDNIFSNNGAGVAVMYTRRVKMYRNTFEKNWGSSSYGMLLKDITDSEVKNNNFTGNTTGIYMDGSSRTIFESNIFRSNGWGVKLQASCDGNTFLKNNFIGNTFDISTNGFTVLNNIDKNYWDKYAGYDLNRDGIGDVPFFPVNLFSSITETVPAAILLWRSFLVFMLDQAEKILPAITPENLKDHKPVMKPYDLR